MSIADKLVYLNDTKTALADAINIALVARGEPPLGANATFRSYAERLIYPGYLFGQGEQGGWKLPPNPDSYFTDTAGTTPAALTDAIALVQGEIGPDWTQGTTSARPVWAREPEGGRRNLLGFTEDFSQSSWTKTGVTFSPHLAPDGSLNAQKIIPTVDAASFRSVTQISLGLSGEASISASLYLKADGYSRVRVYLEQTGGENYPSINVDLTTGAILSASSSLSPVDIEAVGDGWYKLTPSTTTPNSTSCVLQVRVLDNSGAVIFLGDGVSGVVVWGPQVELGSTPTPYQRVATALDVTEAGVPDVNYLRFDLANDELTTSLPAATYTVVLPTRQGIWIDSVTHAGGTFSIGPTSYTGGPAGILTALSSDGVCKMIAPPLVIDRALSAGERNWLVMWYQARGAGELLEVLP